MEKYQVTMYKTFDGEVFDNEEDAIRWEKTETLKSFIEDNSVMPSVYAGDIARFIYDNIENINLTLSAEF